MIKKFHIRYNIYKIGYIFFPFISFLFTLKYYKSSWFKNALWLFIIFYGFSMSFVETLDAYAYRMKFEEAAIRYRSFSSFLDVFDSSKTGQIDFARPLINYILTYFTDNYHVLFGIYGLIFGYFYSRNIDFILKQISSKHSKTLFGLILFLAFYIGIWQINGFRFWTAAHIFTFAIINILYKKNKKTGYLCLFLSLTFHLSFILPALIFVFYNYIPRFNKLFIIGILALSLYNPISNLQVVESYLTRYAYTEQLERKVEDYTSTEAVEKAESSSNKRSLVNIFISLFNRGLILILAWFLIPKFSEIDKSYVKFFRFGLTLALAGAVLSFIPSVGRFLVVGLYILLFSSVMILIKYHFYKRKFRLISMLGFVASVLIIPNNIWILFTFSSHTLFGNYFTVLLDDSEILYSVGNLFLDTYK